MTVGIVGSEAAKFTPETEAKARFYIRWMLQQPAVTAMTSGGCHLGGIDIWAEEEADRLGLYKIIHYPKRLQWSGGYKERNLLIVKDADILYNVTLAAYPETYHGMRFDRCYHCAEGITHVKSGGCWTLKQALKAGKRGELVVVA